MITFFIRGDCDEVFTHKSILHNARNRFVVVDKRRGVYAKKKREVDLFLFRVISGPFSVHPLLGHWHFGKWWWCVIKIPEIWIDVENPSRADLLYESSIFFSHLIQCKAETTRKNYTRMQKCSVGCPMLMDIKLLKSRCRKKLFQVHSKLDHIDRATLWVNEDEVIVVKTRERRKKNYVKTWKINSLLFIFAMVRRASEFTWTKEEWNGSGKASSAGAGWKPKACETFRASCEHCRLH